MVRVFYDPAYVVSAYSFDTTRKAKWIADSLEAAPIPGIELTSPEPLSAEQLELIHDPSYVRAVRTGEPRTLAESQGFVWDPGFWTMVCASNGGVVAAARAALQSGVSGSLSSGLHHARRSRGAAFCTFNGLVLAAVDALAAGAGSVLILDLDAHCGGGTVSLIARDPRVWQVDVSVSFFDTYDSQKRFLLRLVESSREYLSVIEEVLQEVRRRGPRFDLCLYNAGMDPFEGCLIGGLEGITRQTIAARERMVFDWCRDRRIPVAFVQAGGYVGARLDEKGLVGLHRLTLEAAVGQ